MNFVIIAAPALLIMIIMKYQYSHQITNKEMLFHFLAVCVSIGIMMGVTYASLYASMYDTEILNGKVLSKSRDVEWCNSQSSSCKNYTWHERCSYYTDSKGKRQKSCESYKVFDYPYEVDWTVKTSVDSHTIDRVNRQGTQVPPRWAEIKIGDPASTTNSYINYLLGNKDSLFYQNEYEKEFSEEYKKKLPNYPTIYDYYRVNHVINLTNIDSTGYNDYINMALRDMGASKQVNIVLIMYPQTNADFVKALTAKWRGGKKNDVIMFAGLDDEGTVTKFSSTSFAQGMNNEILHSTLRMDALTEKMSLDLVQILVKDVNEHFKRLPNKEFEYLKFKLEPSIWVVLLCSIIAAVSSILVGNYMRKVDL
ncbi:hypothetical protein GAP32_338 [Cronobacter phage vB_CsaM_GAP32]|uniref:Putative membrane protein n=1 Tax=Cronobacter phage vB_CsaM_GAP32 TaxID=1141136 RepID=K4F701_9CAUD|nr:hypothetical protein GAP32_338 [Cronobacter phage vB_CsaM_GAP32]AFC21788.1 putative membrane protein [Cronobacter phage vB_CsaM_GAP32]